MAGSRKRRRRRKSRILALYVPRVRKPSIITPKSFLPQLPSWIGKRRKPKTSGKKQNPVYRSAKPGARGRGPRQKNDRLAQGLHEVRSPSAKTRRRCIAKPDPSVGGKAARKAARLGTTPKPPRYIPWCERKK